jgi:hypothetical protein
VLLLANILHARHPGTRLIVDVTPDSATLRVVAHGTGADAVYRFPSRKGLRAQSWDWGV